MCGPERKRVGLLCVSHWCCGIKSSKATVFSRVRIVNIHSKVKQECKGEHK